MNNLITESNRIRSMYRVQLKDASDNRRAWRRAHNSKRVTLRTFRGDK